MVAILSTVLMFISGCGQSGNISPSGDKDYIIDSMWADQTTIVAGNYTNVYVRIKGKTSGLYVKDIPVSFTTNRDSILTPEPITNDQGIATTTFMTERDSTGTYIATITAKVVAEQEHIDRLDITILPTNFTNPGYIYLTASPDTVYSDGVTEIALTATVLDSLYTPLKNKTVTFQFLQGNQGDLILDFASGTPITGDDGKVNAILTAPTTSRTILISASVIGTADSLADSAWVWVLDIPDVDFIDLSAAPTSIDADGVEELTLTAYVTIGGTGAPAPDGTEIFFTSEAGALLPYTGGKYASAQVQPGKGTAVRKSRNSDIRRTFAGPSSRPASSITAYTSSGYAKAQLRSSTTAGHIECTAAAEVVSGTIADTTYVYFTAGDPFSIVVEAARSQILADGIDTTKITATVYDDYANRVGAGLTVSFSTDKGDVFPSSSLTDSMGQATTTLTSGVITGYARVQATCQSASGYTEVLLANTVPRFIQLSALPTNLPADGVSSSAITAEVLDSAYHPVTDGVRIKFFTDLGTLSGSTREKSIALLGKRNRSVFTADTRETTTSGGFCGVVLTSGFVADSCMVAAWYQVYDTLLMDTVVTAADTIYIPLLPGEPDRIDVTFSRDSIRADELDTCTVWADVYDAYDNPVGTGVAVTFTPEDGGGSVAPTIDNTNASGQAQTVLTSSRVTGWHALTATSATAMAGIGDIYFYPVYPRELRMLADFDSATADGADSVLISVFVTDEHDMPCSDGIEVTFTTELGTFLPVSARAYLGGDVPVTKVSHSQKLTAIKADEASPRGRIDPRSADSYMPAEAFLSPMADSFTVGTVGGYAQIYLIAPTVVGTTWVHAVVAVSDSETAEDSMLVAFKADIPRMIHLTAVPDTIPADGASTSRIAALVTDAHGNPVGDGIIVEFDLESSSSGMGTIFYMTLPTNTESACTTTFRSGYTTGEAVIIASLSSYPTIFNNIGIWLTGGTSGYLNLTVDSTHLSIEGNTEIRAEVFDTGGVHISDGSRVYFDWDPFAMGEVVPAMAITSGGFATASFEADTISGLTSISASCGSVADTEYVYIGAGPAGMVLLTLDSMRIDTDSRMNVTAEVFDSVGAVISDGTPVIFTVEPPELGVVVPPMVPTSGGVSVAEFVSDTMIGAGYIIATAGAVADTKIVYVGTIPAGYVILSVDDIYIMPNDSTGVTAEVFDGSGFYIGDGTPVDFTVEPPEMGDIVPPAQVTTGGAATVTFRSDTTTGTCNIIATSGAVADTKLVYIGTVPAGLVILSVDDPYIMPNDSTSLTAEVFDSGGFYIGDSTPVLFTVEPPEMGVIVPPTQFTIGGAAEVTFRSDTTAGACYVIATAGAIADTKVVYIGTVPAGLVILSVEDVYIMPNDSTGLTAEVFDSSGFYIADSTPVAFTVEPPEMGVIVPPTQFTFDGAANVTFRSDTATGSCLVIATAGAVADTKLVYIGTVPAGLVILSVEDAYIMPNDSTGLMAEVFDSSGFYISDSTPVLFTVEPPDMGVIVPPTQFTIDGAANVTFRSDTATGSCLVIATAGAVADTKTVYIGTVPAGMVLLSVDDSRIGPNDSTDIMAEVFDETGFYIGDSTPVYFTVEPPEIGVVVPPTGLTIDGAANAVFRSDTISGSCLIIATSGAVADTKIVYVGSLSVENVFLTVDSLSIHIGNTMNATVEVFDSSSGPISDGTLVSLTVEPEYMADIVPPRPSTTGGTAVAEFRPDTLAGSCIVIATVGAVADTATVRIKPGPVTDIILTAVPETLLSVGGERSDIVAECFDAYGNYAEDGRDVLFETIPDTMGTIISPTPIDSGFARTTFTSGTVVGRVVIRASIDDAVATVPIEIIATGPGYIVLTTDSIKVTVGTSTNIRASVFDASGRPISDDTQVIFEAMRGTVDPPFGRTLDGYTTSELFATTVACVDTIIAKDSTGTIADTAYVQYVADCPVYIEIDSIIPDSIFADGRSRSDIYMTVKDVYLNYARPGTPILLAYNSDITIIPGFISSPAIVDSQGHFHTIYRASNEVGTAALQAFFANGNDVHDDFGDWQLPYYPTYDLNQVTALTLFDVEQIPPIASFINVTASPNRVQADGTSYSVVTASVYDSTGAPVADGTIINFYTMNIADSTSVGNIVGTAFTTDGIATAYWTAPTYTAKAYVFGSIFGLTDSAMVEFIPGDPSAISLDAVPDSVPADGFTRSTGTATVLDLYNNPVPGVAVDFAVSPFGTITSPMGNTDSIGELSTQIYSHEVGPVTLSASILSGSFVSYTEIVFTPLVAAEIYLTADSAQIIADGISTTEVRAMVLDSFSMAVPDNTPVRFVTDLGFVFPGVAYTTDGIATTVLRSATNVGLATITGDAGDSVTNTVTVDFIPGPPARIDVVANPTSIPADGDTFSEIAVTVYDINSNPVRAGVRVDFSATLGTIDTTAYTDTLGQAVVYLRAGITPGTAVVWASSDMALGQTTVDFLNTNAAEMYLYIDPGIVTADARDTARVTGIVTNSLGMPVTDGSPVLLSITTDTLGPYGRISPITAHTDSGRFEAIFTADRNVGSAYVVADAGSGVVESVFVELIPGPPDSILVLPTDSILPADSFSTTDIHVEVFDRFANPVDAGVAITFEATRGWVEPDSETTNSSGHADVIFTAGRNPGEARVRARAGDATGDAYITLLNSDVGYVSLTADTSSLTADAISTTFLRAYVTDSVGMPVSDGTPVYFKIDTLAGTPADTGLAMLSPTLGFTVAGEAAVQVRSKTQVGRVWFAACTADTMDTTCGTTFIDLVPGPVDSIYAWAEDTTLIANGEDYTIVHAELYDRYDNPVSAGIEVSLSATGGTISPNLTYTNSGGSISSVLIAGTAPTLARVDITAEGMHAIVQVRIGISPPAYLSLRASPRKIAADGESQSIITARVLNELGQPVSDGQIVIFHAVDSTGTPFGSIDTLEVTFNGEAEVVLYSEPRTGTVWVSARVDSGIGGTTLSDTVNVWFTPGPPHHVEVIPEYPILDADGSSTAACTVKVMDEYDNLVEAGERVDIEVGPSTALGSIIPPYVFTDNDAPNVVTFRSGTAVGTAVISATVYPGGPVGAGLIDLRALVVDNIEVFTDSMTMTANGTNTTRVTAYAQDSTFLAVSDSTPIKFYTSSGIIFPGVGYTIDGEVSVTLRSAAHVDTAMIIAYSGSFDSMLVADTTYVRFVPGDPEYIEVVPSQPGLIADGTDTCYVTAYIYDAQGNRVQTGKIVKFETSLGYIDTIAVTTIDTTDDSSGVATVQLRSGTIPGTAVIFVTCEGALGIGHVDFTKYGIDNIHVTMSPDIIVADRHSTAEISGTVRDTLGNLIGYMTPVHIYPLPDTAGVNMGFISPTTVYTDSGNFVTTFTADTSVGICQIVAEVYVGTDTVADTTWCELIPGEPHYIDIWPTPGVIPADSFSTAACSVIVYDRYHNTMQAGVEVTFEATLGYLSRSSDETNANGLTYFDLMSTYSIGTARVTARSGVARGDTFVEFAKSDSAVFAIVINIDDPVLQADGYTETVVTATVIDTNGFPISDRTRVDFSMVPDGFPPPTPTDTFGTLIPTVGLTESGEASTIFRVKTRRGNVWIKGAVGAAVDSVRDSLLVQILPGDLSYITFVADTDTIAANGRDNTVLTATLFDDFNNPLLSGNPVDFGTDLGSINPTASMTNSAGEAFTTLTAGTEPGIARVWARSGASFELEEVTIRQSTVGYLLMTANPVVVTADGMSQSILTCEVYDTEGSPSSDGTEVYFEVHPTDTGGTVVSPKMTLGGSCVTSFTSSTDVGYGEAWIIGKVYTATDSIMDSVRVFIYPGPAATIDVWGDSTHVPQDTLNADAWDHMYVYGRVNDQYGNHLRAGQDVTFSTSLGTITPSSITDTSGIARVVLTSGLNPGDAVLMARSGSAIGYGQINFQPTTISNIIVYSDSSALTADGVSSTSVRAHVYSPGGYLVSDETLVQFVVPSGLAYSEPNIAYTDSGIATTTIRADTIAASSIQILAITCDDTSMTSCDTGQVSIRLDPGVANRIIAYALDSVLYADGASVTAVECTVYDRFSNPVMPGMPVSFETTLGSVLSSGYTNSDGYTFTRLTSGTVCGDALVTIRCQEAIQFVDVRFDSLIADEIVMSVIPALLPGDGTSEAMIRAWVYSAGLYVSDGTRVSFTQDTTGGRITGIITPRIAFTDAGTVHVELTAPIGTGQGRIIANVGATVADTFDVTYQPGEPAIIIFDTMYATTIPADGAGYPVVIHVYDEYMNPVDVGTEVTFATSRGDIITPVSVDSTSGSARTLVSSMEAGPAFITARSGSAIASKPYEFTTLVADQINLVANPIRVTADGISTSNLLVTVFNLDSLGRIRPVSDNTPVSFQSIGSGIISPTTGYTVDGQVNSQLFASVVASYDTIIASVSATLADTAVVEFVAGQPSIVSFVPPINDMNADGADTQLVTVLITDAFGNPVSPGLPVSFSISLGYITPFSATDTLGTASAVIVAGTDFGTASITATCQGVSGYATLNFLPIIADTLYLVVDPPTLVANGSDVANLTAVVFDTSGLPVSDGTIVKFATSSGIVNPVIAYTTGGIATSTLKAGTTPYDTVFVSASAGTSAVDTTYARFMPGPPAIMFIETSDSSIVANGVDSTTVFVTVFDAYGNSVGTGVEVDFGASLGSISPTAYTDTAGQARTRLLSGTTSGFCNVTADAGDAGASMLIEFTPTYVGEVILSVVPPRLTADGSSTASVTCIVLDTIGVPVSDGTPVRFSELNKGSITPLFATTVAGEVNATITAFTSVGWDTLVATSGDSIDTVAIEFVSGPPYYIQMWPADSTLLANETDTTRVYGVVYDEVGNHVGIGHIVNLGLTPSDFGDMTNVTATDDSGAFDFRFRAGRFSGVAVISANCEGALGLTQIDLMPTSVAEISLSIEDRYLDADGISSTEVSAYVTDSAGLLIADGTIVRFAQLVPPGNIEALIVPNRSNTTDGWADVELYAPTIAGSTFVYAYIPMGVSGDTVCSDTQSVYFSPGAVAVVRFDTNYVQLIADGADTLADSAYVEDAFGNPIPGQSVFFSIGLGAVSPPVAVSSGNGGVRFRLTSPTSIGSSYLQATCSGVNGYLPVDFVADTVDTIILTVTPGGLPADGVSSADVRALVIDSDGNPIADGVTIRFSASMGLITPFSTLSGGVANVILVAADTSGVDTIWAFCESESSMATIVYSAGPPASIDLSVVPDTATVGSTTPSVVSGTVMDASSNPVAAGTYVYLTVDSAGTGSVADPVIAVDSLGEFSTFYTPGLIAGMTGITATVNEITAHANILLQAGPPQTMDIAVSRDFIYIRGVGEIDQAVIEAVIYDEYDNPVRDSCAVVFRIVDYPSSPTVDPELIPGGGLQSDTVYTMAGRASVAARSGDRSGSMVIEAVAYIPGGGSIDSRAPRITIGSGLPYTVSVSVGDCNVRGYDVDGVANSVMAIVTDVYDNPVAPGTAVWFTALQGAITTSSVTDDSGFAFATWYSSAPRDSGIVTLAAETRDTSDVIADTTYFYNSGPADSISISISPYMVYADASGIAEIQISMWDVNLRPVTDGTSVNVIADWGTPTSPVTSINECYGSYAVSSYSGANVFRDDYSNQDTARVVEVTANIGGISAGDTVYLKHDLPSSSRSNVSAPGTVPYNTSYLVSVRVVDQWDNPIAGESVTLSAASATGGGVSTTGGTGEASWTLTAPDTTAPAMDVVMVTINSTGAVINASVTYVGRRRRPTFEPGVADTAIVPKDIVIPKNDFYIRED